MGQLAQRKLIKNGNSVVVALPPGWLAYHRLRPGDVVLLETNGRILISPAEGRSTKKKA